MKWFFSFLLLFFFHSACAGILFQDPTRDELNAAIKDMTLSGLEEMAEDDKGRGGYYLGLVYLNGSKRFGVEQNCEKSSELLRQAWQNRIIDAGYMLSVMSYRGICMEKDFNRAKVLAQKTADEGYLLSQRMLGRAYLGSDWQGLYRENVDKAVFWLGKAGESGDSESAAKLSYLYREGVGVKRDEKLSFYWLKKASFSKFDPDEIIYFPSLAEYYENGIGTSVNLVEAYKYYDLSGSAGVDDKQRIAREMTQEQIDEAIRQSQEWQKEHNVQVGGGFIQRAN